MTGRPHLGRAGAGVLIAIAAMSLMQAIARRSDATPVRAQPFVAASPWPVEATPPLARPASAAAEMEATEVIPPGRPAIRAPILMYHYVRVNPNPLDRLGFNLSIVPADFLQQLDWLAAAGYHPVDLDDLRGYLLGRGSLPSRPVVLTFDDGYRDLYTTAFPILRAHRFKAVSYVVPGFFGSASNVTPSQVLEMEAGGIEIASHTVSHADLTRLSMDELRRQVSDSKAMLESLLGHPVVDFCYPSGRYDNAVVGMVQAAGYQTATTTEPGVVHTAGDRFTWSRVRVSGGESLDEFAAALGSPEETELAMRPRPWPAYVPSSPRPPVTFPLRQPPTEPPPAAPVEGLTP